MEGGISTESEVTLEIDDSLLEEEELIMKEAATGDVACSPLRILPNSQVGASSDEPNQKRRGDGYNLRNSLAWNSAFLTEQGVLNPQELSRLSGSHTEHHLQVGKKLFHKSPLTASNNDKLYSNPEITALGSKVTFFFFLHTSKSFFLLDLCSLPKTSMQLKGMFQAGGCPRPSAPSTSQKRLPNVHLRNAPARLKDSKLSVSKSEQSSVSTVPKIAALGAKPSSCTRSRLHGILEKNAFPRQLSNISRTTPSCLSSTSRSSTFSSEKNMATKATTGLKANPHPVPTADAGTRKVMIPFSQNAHYSGRKLADARIYPTKPSGLRMPSPSLRYFAQSQASTFLSLKSPRDTQLCSLHEASIHSLGKFNDTYHTEDTKSLHEPVGTVKMSELGISATKCLIPSAATTASYPSCKSSKEFERSVEEILPASSNLIERQHGEEVHVLSKDMDNRKAVSSVVPQSVEHEHKKSIPYEFEKVQQKENHNQLEIASKDMETTDLSDRELNCDFGTTVQSGYITQLQQDGHVENFKDSCPEISEVNASEFGSSHFSPLLNSGAQSYAVSEPAYFIEHKNDDELQESLRSSPSVDDIDNRNSMVHEVFLHIGNDEEQEQLKKSILDEVENVQYEENNVRQNKFCRLIGQDNTSEKFMKDHEFVDSRHHGCKNNISFNHNETTDISHIMVSDGERNEVENFELPVEDNSRPIALKRKSLFDSRQDALTSRHKLNAAPFSVEWLAALEEVGEDILTMKTGAVQHSPPDKILLEPGPWSPVKRRNVPEIGPFDCTKYSVPPQQNNIADC